MLAVEIYLCVSRWRIKYSLCPRAYGVLLCPRMQRFGIHTVCLASLRGRAGLSVWPSRSVTFWYSCDGSLAEMDRRCVFFSLVGGVILLVSSRPRSLYSPPLFLWRLYGVGCLCSPL